MSLSTLRKLGATLSILALLAGCASSPKGAKSKAKPGATVSAPRGGGYYKDDGPDARIPANLQATPDATPRIEPIARSNTRPYTVLGKSFVPHTSHKAFSQTGTASWYGRKFHGKKTANGETYDMYAMTAAHPTLPIPSYARVTRPKTGKSVIVRINDRGPFHSSRIIDLSYVAAAKLDLIAPGSGTVVVESITQEEIRTGSFGRGEVEVVEAAPPPPVAPQPSLTMTEKLEPTPDALAVLPGDDLTVELDDSPSWSSDANDQQLIVQSSSTSPSKPQAPSGQNRVYLQFGAFSARENAAALAQQLNRQISQVEYRDAQVQMHNDLYRVQIGPYQNRTEAINAAYRIQQKTGLSPSVAVR
ncbi:MULTISPECIES: septal ring lytic transglycosylase RlpA family protein [Alcaligenes]|uniref:Endolytic peptidoglycan transglycosylase RlpA n=1 Tax=Alcaligenes parafaecalis TaxID=171260 RepID=A0ABT3VQ39_9BURK|nr:MULTISPECIES: septal ring lytic transglycosylase RlpA family protein [Alcaligenes]MCX5464261.1 septal ring lytic transglycosylase RlpA family protein [Alcaligenes parafaecalis]QTB98547.1 septal ring lytic transglycosylase RlpA family protein [Alcaligenes sp. SORT26]